MEESSVTGRVQLRCLAALGSPEVSRSRPPPPPTASRHPLLECDTAGNAATPLPKQHEKSQKKIKITILWDCLSFHLPPLPLPLFSLSLLPCPSPTRTASANLSLRVLLFFSLLPVPCWSAFYSSDPRPYDVFVTLKGLSKCNCCRARLVSPRLAAVATNTTCCDSDSPPSAASCPEPHPRCDCPRLRSRIIGSFSSAPARARSSQDRINRRSPSHVAALVPPIPIRRL